MAQSVDTNLRPLLFCTALPPASPPCYEPTDCRCQEDKRAASRCRSAVNSGANRAGLRIAAAAERLPSVSETSSGSSACFFRESPDIDRFRKFRR